VLLFAAGVALVVAPELAQRAPVDGGVIERLAGVQSGVLLLGGLVFLSLGIFGRGIARREGLVRSSPGPAREQGSQEDSPGVEQLAVEVGELRVGVGQLASDLAEIAGTLERLVLGQEDLLERQGQPSDPGPERVPGENDPLFRLASSLDQMHARFDERLSEVTARLERRYADLRALLEAGAREPAGASGRFDGLEDLSDSGARSDSRRGPEPTRPIDLLDPARDADTLEQRLQASSGPHPAAPVPGRVAADPRAVDAGSPRTGSDGDGSSAPEPGR
jgi:hypothetical protein